MLILKFVRPICNCFGGELSCSVPTASKSASTRGLDKWKECGHYSKFSDKEKALLGKYGSIHGLYAILRK